MTDCKTIAYNLVKTGMAVEMIASVPEMDVLIVTLWLNDAGIKPKEHKILTSSDFYTHKHKNTGDSCEAPALTEGLDT